MKKAFLILIASCFVLVSSAEKAKTETKVNTTSESSMVALSGNVIDEQSGEALAGVEVKVEGTDMKTYTDFDGHFVLDQLKQGEYKLVTSYVSYGKSVKTLKVDANSNQVKIELQPSM